MYQMQEGTLALPVEWQDKTMNVFVSAATGTEGVSFVITRERLPWGMKFAEYVSSEIRKVAKQVPDYAEVANEDATVSGRAAH
ncbi:DcrB-related protein, partial [Burkholderia cenocepacia]|nr:DcrB-related protein [Burkholderia cenocepacia]MDR5670839.1 DcrB-related protein [Burkholderia cenocepacia]